MGDLAELGKLVKDLREWRSLTQAKLAASAGCDVETIARVEQGRAPGWRRSTSMSIFKGLNDAKALTVQEATEFARLANVPPKMLLAAIAPPADAVIEDRVARVRVHAMLDLLIDRVGVERARDGVAGFLAVAGEDEPRRFTVVSRPVESKQGDVPTVEQTYVDYEVRDEDEPEAGQSQQRGTP